MSRQFRFKDLMITIPPMGEPAAGGSRDACTQVTDYQPATALPAHHAAFGGCGTCTLVTGCPTTTTMAQQYPLAFGGYGWAFGGCGQCTGITGCLPVTYRVPTGPLGAVAPADLEAYKADLERHLADVEALTTGPSGDELADLEQRLESALEEVRQQRAELQGSSSKTEKA